MKKWILVMLAAMGLPLAAGAFQADVIAPMGNGKTPTFGAQLSLGLLKDGQAKEHVYDYETADGSRRQLSRLDWDLKDIVMGGANISIRPANMVKGIDIAKGLTFNTANGLTINFGYWNALTEGSGEMEDYDWLDTSSTDWTHYSLSDVDVTEGYILDLNVAWDFMQWEKQIVDLTGRVFAGYKQNGWTWEDSGRYLLYPEYGYVPQDLNGENMINYEQEFRMPYLGVGLDATFDLKPIELTASCRVTYSPLVEATDWDDHLAREIHFKEEFEEGEMLGFGFDLRCAFTQGLLDGVFLAAAFDVQTIDLIIGDMEYYDASTGERGGDEDIAGIENEYWILSLGGGYQF